MKTISVPISEAQANLGELVEQVKSGIRVTITTDGRPAAILGPVPSLGVPWRVVKPDDPARNGDLQTPVMEPWR